MNKEEFEYYVNYLRKMNDLGIISDSTYNSLTQEAFENVKAEQRRDAYFGYHLTQNAISFKKKFDTSYWATSPEIAQDGASSPSDSQSVFPPEMIASCVDESLPPFCFEMNGIMVKLDENLQKYVLSSPTQLYYHSKELRPMTRKQWAAKVRWARLRKLNVTKS